MNSKEQLSQQDETADKKLPILVVDDIPENLLLLEDILTDHGYSVVGAMNGLQALEILQEQQISLIIADAMMPKMDGFQLCKTVKNNPSLSKIPFVIYSSDYIDEEDKELAKTIGADKYVVKSGNTNFLLETIEELLHVGRKEITSDTSLPPAVSLDDRSFIERHYKLLNKKLEEKMQNLEMYSLQLLKKNEQLQKSEQRYRLLFEKANIAIFILDSNGLDLLDLNPFAEKLLGYTKEELLAGKIIPFAEHDIHGPLVIVPDFSGELNVRTKDGKILCLEASASALEYDNQLRIQLFARDVTESKAMMEKLFRSEKLSMLGTIAAGIAHEVRNPLAGIKLNLQFLEHKHAETFPDIDVLRLAIQGTQHIEKVVENTLNIARSTTPEVRIGNINEVVSQAVNLLMLTVHKKNVTLETTLSADLPALKIDDRQVLQVMLNILRNAIEATPSEGIITVTTAVETLPMDNVQRVVITVRDSGEGISDEYLNSTFELFKTTKASGTGLGLALSRRIMQQHGGDIAIARPEGGGTEIKLYFPLQ